MLATEYTTVEFTLWLLLAALIGFVIGWLIRNWWLDQQKTEEIAAIRAEEAELRATVESERDDWKGKVAELESDVAKSNADVDRITAQVTERDESIAVLEGDLNEARTGTSKLESKVQDREATIASLRADADKEDAQVVSLRADLDSANGTIGTLRKDADGYTSTIESLRLDLEGERRKQAEIKAELESLGNRADTAETALAGARDTATSLQARVAELEAAASSPSADAELSALRAQVDSAQRDRDATAARLSALEEEHSECTDRLAAAETDGVADPSAAGAEVELPDKEVAVAKVAEIAPRTRGDGPVVDDDLKKIHGVGPKLEKLLKSMDITSFKQVANFTADDIQYVTAALDAFPGRIERDDWMSSAADEHSNKYGGPA